MKINKTLIILSLLLIFCISLGAVSATEDISVNNIDNSVDTVESSVNDDEINAVGDGEILNSSEIYADIYNELDTYYITNDYQIDKTWDIIYRNVIIEGNNHTIYGNGKQAFNILGLGVTIKNLNFVNCSADWGGAIHLRNGGSVKGCSFVNCSASMYGGAIYSADSWPEGGSPFVSNCIFDNNNANGYVIYVQSRVINFSPFNCFFAFQDNVTDFPISLINKYSDLKWAVLKSYSSSGKYIAKFVNYESFKQPLPDYTARLVVGSEEKIITIHNNQFSCEYDPTKTYNVYSLNSGKLLTSLPSNSDNGSIPLFKPKVILTVDDIKGISGSTVKVDVGVHDILGTPINEGTVTISLNGKDYIAKVIDGVATFNILIPSKESIYSAKVSFNAEGTKYDNTTCDFTVTSVEDNDTEDINKSVVSNNMENCGTPLVALLIALISLPIIRRRK